MDFVLLTTAQEFSVYLQQLSMTAGRLTSPMSYTIWRDLTTLNILASRIYCKRTAAFQEAL